MDGEISRRSLLRGSVGACALAGGLSGCGFDIKPAPEVTATADATGQIAITLGGVEPLMKVGGVVILDVTAPSAIASEVPQGGVLLARYDSDQFVATQALCTHLGCPLSYSTKDREVACPCHGSRFAAVSDSEKCAGAVTRGPANSPVRAFKTAYDAASGKITIDLTSAPACDVAFTPTVDGGKVVLPFAKVPALQSPGGTFTGQPTGLGDTLNVVRVDQSTVIALSAICTHQGCTVAYAKSTNNFVCPCHGSNYDLSGNVTAGPAVKPVKKYTAVLDADGVTVTVA